MYQESILLSLKHCIDMNIDFDKIDPALMIWEMDLGDPLIAFAIAIALIIALIIAIIAIVLAIALAPKPPQPKPASFDPNSVPTAEEDRPIPVLFGTQLIRGPNVVWYGDLSTEPIPLDTGGKK